MFAAYRLPVAVATFAIFIGGLLYWGHHKYNQGFNAAVAEYEKRDRKGAEDARKTANDTLRDLDGVDTKRLLDDTNGFRD